MTRTDVINILASRRGFKRYLEIGVQRPSQNFARVTCPDRVGVDPVPIDFPGVVCATSDEFFATNRDAFDLIFIDGNHTEEQVARDIPNALRHLNPRGIVVLHDCLPPDEWHQRPASQYRPGLPWNGTVWKAVLRYFVSSPYLCFVIDTDYGVGMIDTAGKAKVRSRQLLDSLTFERDAGYLRDYVIPASELPV